MSDIRRTLEALCGAFNAHDLDAVMAHFADDCVLEMPRGPRELGQGATIDISRTLGVHLIKVVDVDGKFLGGSPGP